MMSLLATTARLRLRLMYGWAGFDVRAALVCRLAWVLSAVALHQLRPHAYSHTNTNTNSDADSYTNTDSSTFNQPDWVI